MHEQHAPDTPSASAVQRTMAILECLDTSRRGLNISEVSRKLTIPKSSVHVLMVTLERLGYIQRAANGRDFCLSLKTYALGHRLAKMVSISEFALAHMQRLSADTHLTSNLAVLDHDQGVFIQKVEPASTTHLDTYVGRRMDLHCTALGKVILAFTAPEATEHIFAKSVFRRYTPKTITTPQALRKEVTRVRRLQFAVDDEEEQIGVRCVAIPIMHQGVRFIAALSISGSITQIPPRAVEELLPRVRETANAIASENIPLPPLF